MTTNFWDRTMNDVVLIYDGYLERYYDEWRRARQLAHWLHQIQTPLKDQFPITEFMRLPGDPTAEEIQKMKEKEYEERIKEYEKAKEYYKSKGLLN